MNSEGPICIDLFAGAGGLSYGLSQAGLNVVLGVDIDKDASTTLKNNSKNMKVVTSDVRCLDPEEVISEAGFGVNEIDIAAGGPPCQGFSKSNTRTRSMKNPLNHLYKEFFKFVKLLNPSVFILENVAGLKSFKKCAVLTDMLNTAVNIGYHTQWTILDAADFGVPQRRKRLFIIGTKHKVENIFPKPTKNFVTVREAISDLPVLENGNHGDKMRYSKYSDLSEYQKIMRESNGTSVSNNFVTKNTDLIMERYKHIPQGGNWKDIPDDLMRNYSDKSRCHGGIYRRLWWDEPSVVIANFRKNMLIHPEQHRGLSVREAARLQSFPDHYTFYGARTSQQQQAANAVPPLLAKTIGENILNEMGDVLL